MQTFKNRQSALKVVGGLSEPSKMPCWGYSIPASKCITGKKLRLVKGSICSICYALKGRYNIDTVKDALNRRFNKLNHPRWIDAMVYLIKNDAYFRWHDSGDIQSISHLKRIARVAENTPNTIHWLPTREYQIVSDYCKSYTIPSNLVIRLSAIKIDGPAPESLAKKLGVCVSGVSKTAFNCIAPKQESKCGSCRACWKKDVFNISYKSH